MEEAEAEAQINGTAEAQTNSTTTTWQPQVSSSIPTTAINTTTASNLNTAAAS